MSFNFKCSQRLDRTFTKDGDILTNGCHFCRGTISAEEAFAATAQNCPGYSDDDISETSRLSLWCENDDYVTNLQFLMVVGTIHFDC